MEHPCYRCHADIPESTAFCPHCGAPQIRVAIPESQEPEQLPALETARPSALAAPPAPWVNGASANLPLPGQVLWSVVWKEALLCGVGAAVLFVVTVPALRMGAVIWMLAAGVFTVRLYRRRAPGMGITQGMGMRLGALAGLFGSLTNAATSIVSFLALRNSGDFHHAMEEQMQIQMAGNSDPRVQRMMQSLLDFMSTPQGAATMIAIFLVIFGAIFIVLSAAGGALGASFSGHRSGPR